MSIIAKIYREHIEELHRRARDDDFHLKSIFIMALLAEGWRYDPDETNVVELNQHKAKTAGIRRDTYRLHSVDDRK